MTAPVLFCTVGGSSAPIITAIRTVAPAHVVFLVTADGTNRDGTPQPGSLHQLEGADSIPVRAGLDATSFTSVTVPADDPSIASARISEVLRSIRARFPETRLIADYTGGTKSMSAALLAAAIDLPGVTLEVMAGARSDLTRVIDGTERPFPIVPDLLLIARQASLLRGAWKSFGYAEAEAGFIDLGERLAAIADVPADLRHRIADVTVLSAAFAAWDRFDHAGARSALRTLSPDAHADWLAPWRTALDALLDLKIGRAARLLDLWRNAERRAARGQYDDAVARCYRLIEATAQYVLFSRCGINTGKIVLTEIPDEARGKARLEANRDGFAQANLSQAWTLLNELLHDGAAAKFMRAKEPGTHHNHRESRVRLLEIRNYSILAHGWEPIGEDNWRRFADWMTRSFVPQALMPEIEALVPSGTIPQLPVEPPDDL